MPSSSTTCSPTGNLFAPDFDFHQGPPLEVFARNSVLVVEDHTTSNEFLHASDIQALTVCTNNLYLDGSLNGSGLMYVFDDMFYRTVNPEYDPPQTVVIDGGTNDNAYTINTTPVKGGPTDSDDNYLVSGVETGYSGVEISNTFPSPWWGRRWLRSPGPRSFCRKSSPMTASRWTAAPATIPTPSTSTTALRSPCISPIRKRRPACVCQRQYEYVQSLLLQ